MSIEACFLVHLLFTASLMRSVCREAPLRRLLLSALLGASGGVIGVFLRAPAFSGVIGVMLSLLIAEKNGRLFLHDLPRCLLNLSGAAGVGLLLRNTMHCSTEADVVLVSLGLLAIGRKKEAGTAVHGNTLIRVETDRCGVTLRAMVDTGNGLREPISGDRVVVVGKNALRDAVERSVLNDEEALPPGYRLIRYRGLGSEGWIRCFRPRRISIRRYGGWQDLPHLWVGLYGDDIPGEWEAVLPAIEKGTLHREDF